MKNQEKRFKYRDLRIGKSILLKEGELSLSQNKITVIIGPNGCGKSSFLLEMAGLRPDYISALDSDWSTNWEQVGLVSQDYNNSLFPWLGVKGNLKFYRNDPAEYAKKLIDNFATNSIRKLSGGMKQRLAIAKEIGIKNNGLLLLDEPFSGQHPTARLLILEVLGEFMESGGNVIIITHEYEILSLPSIQTYQFKLLESDYPLPTYTMVKYEKN